MVKDQSNKPSLRALRRANTERVVKARFRELLAHEYKDPKTGTFVRDIPEPGTLHNEGPYGGCGKGCICRCSEKYPTFQDHRLEVIAKDELKNI